mmetsp:Transcript_3656/g.6527  ORF Transcript_3656/g.6527 Transcript_3656/m.6527 type:complete len:591 (-) Transcript_3656:99-1871(-)
MPTAVDTIQDSDSDVAEIVAVIDSDDEDDVAEVGDGSPPLSFHGYRRGRELGQGGSSQVFVCSKDNCKVGFAVKMVNLRRFRMSPDAERERQKLWREIEIWQSLPAHPNIVQLVDCFQDGDWVLMILELVGGGDLFTVLTSRSVPRMLDKEASVIGNQLVRGLVFLHAQGVIHRDLKLENVLVASQKRAYANGPIVYNVKITDFGLSRILDPSAAVALSTVGTQPYCAPEVLGEGSHSFSADTWCLGVLLFILLSGHYPFVLMPSGQAELDQIIDRASATHTAKEILLGLLRIQPTTRSNLSDLLSHAWFQDDMLEGKPVKRHRTRLASDVGDTAKDVAVPIAIHLDSHKETPPIFEEIETPAFEEIETSQHSPCQSPFPCSPYPGESPMPGQSPLDLDGITSPGLWSPFVEDNMDVKAIEVQQPAEFPSDHVQVQIIIKDKHAGFILGKSGTRIQKTASKSGCKVWMTSRDGSQDRRVIIIGPYRQSKMAQMMIHEQLSTALQMDWQDAEAETILLVRAEAAGMVTGKQGYALNQIRKRSGARVQLLRDEVQGTRPCKISGNLQQILKAQKHIFELVRGVRAVSHGACS